MPVTSNAQNLAMQAAARRARLGRGFQRNKITLANVASVELGSSDEIIITLLGKTPNGVPLRHEFKGRGLQEIDTILLDLGVHVVAWMVDSLPWQAETAMPLIVRARG